MDETMLSQLKSALAKSQGQSLNKAFVQSASATGGLTAYNLEGPAKLLYPVLTPLRNAIPRETLTAPGIQANWRAITGINTAQLSPGLVQGQRGGTLTTTTANYFAAFVSLGFDDYVTFEADLAAQGFDDVKARASEGLLNSLMLAEEGLILAGNGTFNLGTTPTPVTATATTGGSIAATTALSFIAVAVTYEGYLNAVANSGAVATVTRPNADGTSATYGGGAAQKSASGTVTTGAGSFNTVSASVTAVPGAFGYVWYVGAAGSEYFAKVTRINSVLVTSVPVSGNLASALPASDNSPNGNVFNGLLTISAQTSLNPYWVAQPTGTPGTGTGLTADGSGGIVEFDALLQDRWDKYRLSPDKIWVSSQEMNFIRKKVLGGATSANTQRFIFTASQPGFQGGSRIQSYTNPFALGSGKDIPIDIHPNLPAGTVLFTSSSLPYKMSNVTDVMRVLCRRDYHQIEWPLVTRSYQYGVYTDEVFQHYAPFSLGQITNIASQ